MVNLIQISEQRTVVVCVCFCFVALPLLHRSIPSHELDCASLPEFCAPHTKISWSELETTSHFKVWKYSCETKAQNYENYLNMPGKLVVGVISDFVREGESTIHQCQNFAMLSTFRHSIQTHICKAQIRTKFYEVG